MLTPHSNSTPSTPTGPAAIEHHHRTDESAFNDVTMFGELLRRTELMTGLGVPRTLFDPDASPDARVCAYTVNKWVMRPDTPLSVRDAVWRYIIEHVRDHGGDWQLYAVIAQFNALKIVAVRLAPKGVSKAKIRRANDEVIGEFLTTCGRMQIRTAHVGARLVNQTRYHATKAYWGRDNRAYLFDPNTAEDTGRLGDLRLRVRPFGHPDFVLVRLIMDTAPSPRNSRPPTDARIVGHVRRPPDGAGTNGRTEGQALRAIDAELVARTRMERHWPPGSVNGLRKTIDDAAAEVDGIDGGEAGKKRRQRAEAIIIRELRGHQRSGTPQPPPPTKAPEAPGPGSS